MRAGLHRELNPFIEPEALTEQAEKTKASIRSKVEHPLRVPERQFGYAKVRYRGLAKNTSQIVTLFDLSNLWMARRRLMGTGHECVCKAIDGLAGQQTCEFNGVNQAP